MSTLNKERYMTVTQVANALGESHTSVYRHINSGDLPATDLRQGHYSPAGKRRFKIAKEDFNLFIKNKETYMSVTRAANTLGVTRQTVYGYIQNGYLPYTGKSGGFRAKGSVSPGRSVYITKTDFDSFLKQLKARKFLRICPHIVSGSDTPPQRHVG